MEYLCLWSSGEPLGDGSIDEVFGPTVDGNEGGERENLFGNCRLGRTMYDERLMESRLANDPGARDPGYEVNTYGISFVLWTQYRSLVVPTLLSSLNSTRLHRHWTQMADDIPGNRLRGPPCQWTP